MAKADSEQTVICYVDKSGIATLRCPVCGIAKTIDTTNKEFAFKTYKATCSCGCRIRGRFEFRQYYRKKVSLAGSYHDRKTGLRGDIVVENISLTGIRFSSLRKHRLQEGDELDVTFPLDTPQQSKVTLWVVVTNINDRIIGAKRQDLDVVKPDLGFYLR